ncbi:cofilin-like [Haliotis rubra]|uniref:cofilin-like n=1 Tax=Haliotis rubra TaxID=36100 RepID=UPI001EE6247F|nr:cofilin-like [Haliotis rubra]
MASGITLDEEALDFIAKDTKGHVYKYVIFKINDKKTKICLDQIRLISDLGADCKTVEADKEEFKRLGEIVPKDNMRYIMYTYVDQTNNYQRSLIRWLGPDAKVNIRMVYASSENVIRNRLGGKLTKLMLEDEFQYPQDIFQAEDPQKKLSN